MLWLVAGAGAAILAYWRYKQLDPVVPAGPAGNGGDFWTYLHGARQISAGRGLYSGAEIAQGSGYGYVYSPLLAVALIPFAAAATVRVWHAYTAVAIACLVLFAALVTATCAPYLRSWRQPVMFGFTAFTVLLFLPTEVELLNGQSDAFVLVFLAAAVLASESGRPAAAGLLTGVGGLIKTWPAAIALAFFQRGYRGRLRALGALVATLLLAPVLALATGGTAGLIGFFTVTIQARSQQLLSYSVWGVPKNLFSRSGLARPVVVSASLQAVVTTALVALVVGLLVLSLRRSDGSALGFWNVTGCVVLLLPVSHSAYAVYLLPLFWIWASRWLAAPRSGLVAVVTALLALWWLALFHKQWDSSLPAAFPARRGPVLRGPGGRRRVGGRRPSRAGQGRTRARDHDARTGVQIVGVGASCSAPCRQAARRRAQRFPGRPPHRRAPGLLTDFSSRVVRSSISRAISPRTNVGKPQGASRRPRSRRHGVIPDGSKVYFGNTRWVMPGRGRLGGPGFPPGSTGPGRRTSRPRSPGSRRSNQSPGG